MPRKTAAEKAAEEAAAAEAARRETERRRLAWVAVAVIALALFAGGYAAGQSNAEEIPAAFLPVDGGVSPAVDVPFDQLPEFYREFYEELPPFLSEFDGEFPPFPGDFDRRFDFDPRRLDRLRDLMERDLVCDVVERGPRALHLRCTAPRLDRLPLDGPTDEDPRESDGTMQEPGFMGLGVADTERGVTVIEVLDEGPAARAGVELDDVVVAFDDVAIESARQLADLIIDAGAGADVDVTVLRLDSEVTVSVVLGERPE
jgi:hypothetical protein